MKIKEKLQLLLGYYCTTRQAGHTERMLFGAAGSHALVLVSNFAQANEISAHSFANLRIQNFVTLQNLDRLRGRRQPLCIDNGAMTDILRDSANEIDRLERENAELRKQVDTPGPNSKEIPLREPLPLGENENRGGLVSPQHTGYHTKGSKSVVDMNGGGRFG